MKAKYKTHPIFKNEIKRTFPVYVAGMFFHAICIYILYKIPTIIGQILDLLLEGNVEKQTIMSYVYTLIGYSVFMIIPRIIYRTLYFSKARVSDTYLRKKVVEHLQYVKPEYYDKEDKGAYLAYLSKEILMVYKFFGNAFFNTADLLVLPIIGIVVIAKNVHPILALSSVPFLIVAVIWLIKLYHQLDDKIEKARIIGVEYSKLIEQNTSRIFTYQTIQ